ncbi:alpha/beta hydrolase [Nibribacter koreensis]|uniref:Alpha/beta hydrolase n=2 Tax=Nibribacter koreensis TaxID=1084519 RepID=A0ABP8FBK5_9BACT
MLDEKGFVKINGIDQWVTIKGDMSKPVILFLHGGPGSTFSPYSEALFKGWEKDYVLVHWDQRGAGKTYGKNAPAGAGLEYYKANPLTLDQLASDGIAVTEYALKRVNQKKAILFGTSWGSMLGVKIATTRPDLYKAYIGHSQIVDFAGNDKKAYQRVLELAQQAKDKASVETLTALGEPPYAAARKTGQFMRVIKKYERERSKPAPETWFHVSPEYASEADAQHREEGDDYSFLHFAGDQSMGITPMAASVNYLKDALTFKMPVYFIQGEEDIITSKQSTKEYFNKIKAPNKLYYLLGNTAHGFNEQVMETLAKVLKEITKVKK